jgi:hypothetical protein
VFWRSAKAKKMCFDVYVRRSIMFRGKLLIVVAFVAALLISANAQAVSISTSYGLMGADIELNNDSARGPNVPRGTTTSIEIRDYAGTRMKLGYIRFDLSYVTPAPGYDLTNYLNNATLSLEMYSDGKGMPKGRWIGIYGVANSGDRTGTEAWPEATTTYGGGVYDSPAEGTVMTPAPGMVTTAPVGYYAINETLQRLGEIWILKDAAHTPYGIYTSTPTEVVQDDPGTLLTSGGSLNLDEFLKADNNQLVTFAIFYEASSSSSGVDWFLTTKEGVAASSLRMAPTLNLPNAVIPEPATIALLGLGGLSLLRIRRKR